MNASLRPILKNALGGKLTPSAQNAVSPESVVGAALITQVAVIIVVFVGSFLIWRTEEPGYLPIDIPKSSTIFRYTLGLGLLTIVYLCFSDAFSNIWRPLAGVPFFGIVGWKNALFGTWMLDIVSVGGLVYYTEGSRRSPFTATLFVFPTIALFLHESGMHLFYYAGVAIALYTLCILKAYGGRADKKANTGCLWFVSVSCFVLTTGLGFLTRS